MSGASRSRRQPTRASTTELREAPLEAIARHWPEAPALLERAAVAPWGPVNEFYDIRRAGDLLGWRPRWGFNEYLAALRDGREEL